MQMTARDERNFARIFGHSKRVSDGDGLDACAEALARDEDADLNADEFTLRGRLRNRHGLSPRFTVGASCFARLGIFATRTS
jgi:hypothetical protein